MQSFENRWADPRFKTQAIAFLRKFVGTDNKPIENPALLCRQGRKLDGKAPLPEEVKALGLSLVFAFVDKNPRGRPEGSCEGWAMVTADNAELCEWAIDLERERITLSTGYLVKMNIAGKISNPKLVLKPPLDLHMPMFLPSPAPLVLTGIYETVLRSLRSPGQKLTADRVRVAVEWFAKAWLNTATVHYPERLVYLKTAFEALTGTSTNWKSACKLREIFEALPHTTEGDSEVLVWSPEEKPVHTRNWDDKNGHHSALITDLEHWFMAFGKARNTIIHEGQVPELKYKGPKLMCKDPNPAYDGHFVFTAEFLLRVAIKVLLSKLGYDDAWLPEFLRNHQDSPGGARRLLNRTGPSGVSGRVYRCRSLRACAAFAGGAIP